MKIKQKVGRIEIISGDNAWERITSLSFILSEIFRLILHFFSATK